MTASSNDSQAVFNHIDRVSPRSLCPFHAAQYYSGLNWPVLPMRPKSKMPLVTWKEYRDRRYAFLPTHISCWFEHTFPDAGIAVMLGLPSRILAVDVDGKEPYELLLQTVGQIPATPTIKSGNPDPFRLQFLFRLPEGFPTKAKLEPIGNGLEFRGDGGLSMLPPSVHPSGNTYYWLPGLSPEEVEIARLPVAISDAWLRAMRARDAKRSAAQTVSADVSTTSPTDGTPPGGVFRHLSNATRQFLLGKHAKGPRWNERLFNAACDLAGNDVPWELAVELLIAGAAPWNAEEDAKAMATIQSAYAEAREPAREWGMRQTLKHFGGQPRK